MFNADLWPTPGEVVARMAEGEKIEGCKWWEPSAGTGKIAKYLVEHGAEVLVTEKDPELRKILQTDFQMLGEDCLKITSDQVSHLHGIMMNPPFIHGAEHINHIWSIAPAGCRIVALCNLETLKNPYCKSREELKTTVEAYGTFEDLGECFSQAERKTWASVALIRMEKPGAEYGTEFNGFFMEEEEEGAGSAGLMSYNVVRDLVNRYVESIKIFDQQMGTAVRLNEMARGYFNSNKQNLSVSVTRANVPVQRAQFKKDMQRDGWQFIFSKLNIEKYATRGLKEDINKFVENQAEVPFTMRNIYKMLEIVIGTNGARMDKALLEVFDKVTSHYDDNRYNLEGWKTNSHYLLTRKFILPRMCPVDKWHTGGQLTNCYGGYFDLIEDLEKALCYITGTEFQEEYKYRLREACRDQYYGDWFDWSFFRVKAFKKGTMHFEFKDEGVWAKFNQRIAKLKGYPLPEKKERTRYEKRQTGYKDPEGMAKKAVVLETIEI